MGLAPVALPESGAGSANDRSRRSIRTHAALERHGARRPLAYGPLLRASYA